MSSGGRGRRPLCKEVRKSEDILIGGAKFYAQTGGVVVNETLDENLNHCREELMVLMGKYLRVDEVKSKNTTICSSIAAPNGRGKAI